MNRENLLILFFFISLLFESTLISIPFVFLLSLIYYIIYSGARTIIVTVIFGVLADIISVSVIGQTPLALLMTYLSIELYKKAFDTRDWRIFLFILFAATYVYSKIFSYSTDPILFLSIFVFAWIIINFFIKRKLVW